MLDLLEEYKQARKGLKQMLGRLGDSLEDLEDKKQINSMIDSINFIIHWLETGRNPEQEKGAEIGKIYHVFYYEDMQIFPDIHEQLRENEGSGTLQLSEDQKKQLVKIFSELSNRERQCFIMFNVEGLSMQQIADVLGISKASVQTYVKRAQQKINKVLKRED